MMSEVETREEILNLLARGKISIDEVVELLDQSPRLTDYAESDQPLYKAEIGDGLNAGEAFNIKVDDQLAVDELPAKEKETQLDEILLPEFKSTINGKQPRWLRVQVINSKTGNNKVAVNIPFGMVKFGLGIARVFSPEMKGVDFDEINDLLSNADAGLLVEVQDEESNEHVRIFFD